MGVFKLFFFDSAIHDTTGRPIDCVCFTSCPLFCLTSFLLSLLGLSWEALLQCCIFLLRGCFLYFGLLLVFLVFDRFLLCNLLLLLSLHFSASEIFV
jgi:hypothetical protein